MPALFIGGLGPGLLLAVFLSVYVMFTIKGPAARERADDLSGGQSAGRALLEGLVPLFMPVFVVGSILLGVVLYRTIQLSALPRLFSDAMRDSAVILVIIAAVSAANWLLTYNRVPNMLTEWVLSTVDSQTIFLLAVMVLLLFVGLFLEGIAASNSPMRR